MTRQAQVVDLTEPIAGLPGQAPPVVIDAFIQSNNEIAGGVPSSHTRRESYVLYSALPDELKRRIEMAVQALAAAG